DRGGEVAARRIAADADAAGVEPQRARVLEGPAHDRETLLDGSGKGMFGRLGIVDAQHGLPVPGGDARGDVPVRLGAALDPAPAMHVDHARLRSAVAVSKDAQANPP